MIEIGDWMLIKIPNLRGLVEPHVAIPLPLIIPRSMLKAIIRREFPGLYVNFLCTKNNLIKILKQYKDISTIFIWDYVYPSRLFYRNCLATSAFYPAHICYLSESPDIKNKSVSIGDLKKACLIVE